MAGYLASKDDLLLDEEDLFHSDRYMNIMDSDRFSYPYHAPSDLSIERQSPDEDANIANYIGYSVSIVSLIAENLLSHPFLVLRRQCQINDTKLTKCHLTPVTLVPVVINLHKRQSIATLWKGIGSVLMVRGLTLAVDDLVSKFTSFPKDINRQCTVKQIGQNLLLKCISLTIITPFYSASLVETVQSDIASEKPGILDVFREGTVRLLSWSAPRRGRMLPIWALIGPTVSLGLAKYIFSLIVRGAASGLMHVHFKLKHERKGALPKDSQLAYDEIELDANLVSMILTDVVFFPFETIVHRLHMQGTRTIIDNLNDGYSVLPILTNYKGAIDCYTMTLANEGVRGLYKGFGALLLQFAAHIALVKITKFVLCEVSELICSSNTPPAPVVPPTMSSRQSSTPGVSRSQFTRGGYASSTDSYSIP